LRRLALSCDEIREDFSMPVQASASVFPESYPRLSSGLDVLIPVKLVARVLRVHTSTVRAMSRRGDFPPPVNMGARKILYLRSVLDTWYAERVGIPGARFPID